MTVDELCPGDFKGKSPPLLVQGELVSLGAVVLGRASPTIWVHACVCMVCGQLSRAGSAGRRPELWQVSGSAEPRGRQISQKDRRDNMGSARLGAWEVVAQLCVAKPVTVWEERFRESQRDTPQLSLGTDSKQLLLQEGRGVWCQ